MKPADKTLSPFRPLIGEAKTSGQLERTSSRSIILMRADRPVFPLLRPIYPGGGLAMKRLRHALILSGIVFSLYLDTLYDSIIDDAQTLTSYSQQLAVPVAEGGIHTVDFILPAVERIENSSYGWVLSSFDLPSTTDLKDSQQKLSGYKSSVEDASRTLVFIGTVARYTRWLFWVAIAYSMVWVLLDLVYGRSKIQMSALLIITIGANVVCHQHLYGDKTILKTLKIEWYE